MRRVVITGATGMIGLAVISKMIADNIEVLAVVRPDSPKISRIPKHPLVTVLPCDMEDLLSISYDKPCDAFFHLAWAGTTGGQRDDADLQTRNIQSALSAVKLAGQLGCSVFVGAGSQAEYGIVPDGQKLSEDTPCFPKTCYGMAKLCAGNMTRVAAKKAGMRHIWIRILSVYGPWDGMQSMVMSGMKMLSEGQRPKYTKGEQMWDYLFCDDAAEAIFLAAEKGKDGAVYCLGSGQVRPLSEYITAIRDAVDPGAEIGLGEIGYYPNQVMYLCADISKLTEDTGFIPKTSFEEGIRKTYTWYTQERNGD